MEATLWYLKRCPLFEGLSSDQAERLDRHAVMRKFKKRALVYSPTEPGQSVMVLAKGQIKIKDITPEGKETILTFIEPGEIFGELAILDDEPRQDYAEAVADSEVLVLTRESLLWLMQERGDVTLSITKLMGFRRKHIENRLRNVLFLSSRERMVRILHELVQTHGDRVENYCEIRLSLSHQDLASLIGVTRETVTVVLGQLQGEKLIKIRRRHLSILDCERLEQECRGNAPIPPPKSTHSNESTSQSMPKVENSSHM